MYLLFERYCYKNGKTRHRLGETLKFIYMTKYLHPDKKKSTKLNNKKQTAKYKID